MGRGERRKCRCCRQLFRPDPRNRHHQYYCSAPTCRAASKAASQANWLAQPENQNYFRGFERDGTLAAIGTTIRGEPAFGRG